METLGVRVLTSLVGFAVVLLTLGLAGYDTAQVMRRHAIDDRDK